VGQRSKWDQARRRAHIGRGDLKKLGKPPRVIAEMIAPELAKLPFAAAVTIAGPGFINIKLRDEFIMDAARNYKLPKDSVKNPLTIAMDYGSYNVAKSMHMGHFRPSIVGDTFSRIAKYLGHRIISYNHIGDWGKPMALVIAWIIKKFPNDWNKPDFKINKAEFNGYYPAAAKYAKEDPEFLARVLKIKKEFQDGHPEYAALYQKMMNISLKEMDDIIKRLNMMPFDNTLGERNAAKYLGPVEKILRGKNLLVMDAGAEIIVVKRAEDNAPMPPFMFYDSRGADTYDSTDIAALYYRKITDNPDRIIYLTDARQNLHFKQLFRVAEMSGIFPVERLEHIWHGTVNGPDGTPFKTRDGKAAELTDIISMVNDAARARIAESGKNLSAQTTDMIAVAALKFNELMHDVKSDYVFDPDAVIGFEGRTGPYILYTAVRLNAILNKAKTENRKSKTENIIVQAAERDLILTVLDFDRMINVAFDKRATDLLANYTYDLCQSINSFYHHCPILAEGVDAATRAHRLNIVRMALSVLKTCIDLMGMKTPDEM
jgi:arginyl-tRNA synthetase